MSGLSCWPLANPTDISQWVVIAGGGGGGSPAGSTAFSTPRRGGGGGSAAPGLVEISGGGGGGGYARDSDGIVNVTAPATGQQAAISDHPFYPSHLPGRGGGSDEDGNPGYVLVIASRCGPEWGGPPSCLDDIRPPEPVTDVAHDPNPNVVSWTPSASSDASGVVIRRSSAGYPQLPDDGELVADLPATATSFQLPDDDAYYSIFVYDAVGNFSAPAHVNRVRRGQLTRKGPAALPRRGLACARLAAALSSPFLPLEGQRRTGAPGSRQPRLRGS